MFQLTSIAAVQVMLVFCATAQQAPKTIVARCTPKVKEQRPLPKDLAVAPRKGEKSTGYTPLISLQILESGEVVNTRLKRSCGFGNVDRYALEWVRGTRYNARPGCGIIETNVDVLIHWK
jgi:TonB family protein